MSGRRDAPWPERCHAQIKWIHRWRCSRYAEIDGLCIQHWTLGALVPARWKREVNKHGVEVPTPVGPYERVWPEGAAEAQSGTPKAFTPTPSSVSAGGRCRETTP